LPANPRFELGSGQLAAGSGDFGVAGLVLGERGAWEYGSDCDKQRIS
jgi:hypothetical protein